MLNASLNFLFRILQQASFLGSEIVVRSQSSSDNYHVYYLAADDTDVKYMRRLCRVEPKFVAYVSPNVLPIYVSTEIDTNSRISSEGQWLDCLSRIVHYDSIT